MINEHEAMPSKIARKHHRISPVVIFIRGDGWTLGAPAHLEGAAFQLNVDEWIGYLRKSWKDPRPISEYPK